MLSSSNHLNDGYHHFYVVYHEVLTPKAEWAAHCDHSELLYVTLTEQPCLLGRHRIYASLRKGQ